MVTFATVEPLTVNIINRSTNPLPTYATAGASGMDIRANLEHPVQLKPLQRALIPTGLFIEIPPGYEAQVRPRSGLAIKNGLTCLNTPGTIDADYRGELKIIMINLSEDTQSIVHGDRVAQLVIQRVERADLVEVNELNDSVRGTGGFGHTGTE